MIDLFNNHVSVYVKFLGKNGHDWQSEFAIKDGLIIGQHYEVTDIDMGQSFTTINIKSFRNVYNSVMFEFMEEVDNRYLVELDIYEDERFNPYIPRKYASELL